MSGFYELHNAVEDLVKMTNACAVWEATVEYIKKYYPPTAHSFEFECYGESDDEGGGYYRYETIAVYKEDDVVLYMDFNSPDLVAVFTKYDAVKRQEYVDTPEDRRYDLVQLWTENAESWQLNQLLELESQSTSDVFRETYSVQYPPHPPSVLVSQAEEIATLAYRTVSTTPHISLDAALNKLVEQGHEGTLDIVLP